MAVPSVFSGLLGVLNGVGQGRLQKAIQKFEQQPGAWLWKSRQFVSPRLQSAPTPSGHFASLIPKDTLEGHGGPGGSLAGQHLPSGFGKLRL